MTVYTVFKVVDSNPCYGDCLQGLYRTLESAKIALGSLVDENPWNEYFISEVKVHD